jgi:hypothetical protein
VTHAHHPWAADTAEAGATMIIADAVLERERVQNGTPIDGGNRSVGAAQNNAIATSRKCIIDHPRHCHSK